MLLFAVLGLRRISTNVAALDKPVNPDSSPAGNDRVA